MASMEIPHRPFGSELITGLQLPDGFFEASLGRQRVNAHFVNTSGGALADVRFYIESVSHPGIVVTPQTFEVTVPAGAARLNTWIADFSACPPGTHRVSFIAEVGGTMMRMIKKIFVTRVGYDPVSRTFSITAPEGELRVEMVSLVGPKRAPCCGTSGGRDGDNAYRGIFDYLASAAGRHDRDFKLCLRNYLLGEIKLRAIYTPPYSGQLGDLPYQDPWWKVLLCILAFLLLVAAAIAEAVDGTGEISTTGGPGGTGSPTGDCCGLAPSGGGTSYVAAGLLAAAAAAATAAALSDAKDPFRRGQEATDPGGAQTLAESLEAALLYGDPIQCGKPFAVGTKWRYVRHTTAGDLPFDVSESNQNIHVVSRYEIEAPDVIRRYREDRFIVKARFYGPDERPLVGNRLLVQCFLCGPSGEYAVFPLCDDGVEPDEKPNDGTYTGIYDFFRKEKNPSGFWKYFVIAQDVNTASEGMKPEEAATIIGGMVLTGQLTIDFSGGTCALVEDGQVQVIA